MGRTVRYSSTRLTFKRDVIEPLDWDDVIIIDTDVDGTYKMTKADFYRVFDNVVRTDSYRNIGSYNYKPPTPSKARQFLVRR